MLENDLSKINSIIKYCEYIDLIMTRINLSYDVFLNDFESQQSISFDILQIGETANKLSVDFKNEFNTIPWNKIIGMRNFIVHNYGAIDTFVVFNTAKDNIPELKSNLLSIIENK